MLKILLTLTLVFLASSMRVEHQVKYYMNLGVDNYIGSDKGV
jgi:hypothetical protein